MKKENAKGKQLLNEAQTEILNLKKGTTSNYQPPTQKRVTGKNIDDLQAVMKHLKSLDFKAPLVFDNFR